MLRRYDPVWRETRWTPLAQGLGVCALMVVFALAITIGVLAVKDYEPPPMTITQTSENTFTIANEPNNEPSLHIGKTCAKIGMKVAQVEAPAEVWDTLYVVCEAKNG